MPSLVIEVGAGRVVPLPAPVANVFVSDPKIAEVRPASPTSLFLFGVAAGRTTVAALNAAGATIRQYTVTVRPSGFGATEAAGSIGRAVPSANVRLEAQPKAWCCAAACTPADAAAAASTATAYLAEGQTLENRCRVNRRSRWACACASPKCRARSRAHLASTGSARRHRQIHCELHDQQSDRRRCWSGDRHASQTRT